MTTNDSDTKLCAASAYHMTTDQLYTKLREINAKDPASIANTTAPLMRDAINAELDRRTRELLHRAELNAAQADKKAWTCTTCGGRGMYRKDESSWFACDCEDSVRKQDSHSDQAIELDEEWADPEAHERLKRDIKQFEANLNADEVPWPGVHPLEGRDPGCMACGESGVIMVHPGNHSSPPEYERCTCPAGEPPIFGPPLIPHTDEEWLSTIPF